jgi:hypothetical protein
VGLRGHSKSRDYNFMYGKKMRNSNWEQGSLYTTEYYQQLRE